MQLIASNVTEARAQFDTLALRTQSAEATVAVLQATVDHLNSAVPVMAQRTVQLTDYAVGQLQTNAQLTAQQAGAVSPDVTLENFIRSLGLAVALSEATMPDRTISTLTATLQTYFTLDTSGGSRSVGLRLYQPELGAPVAAATLTFELSKVTSADAPVPRNLFTVLTDKQATFSDPFFEPYAPATRVVAAASSALAAVSSWTFPFVIAQAVAIAGFESALAGLLVAPGGPAKAQAYAAAVQSLSTQANALASASDHVAGDVYALASALDATTKTASTLAA